MNMSAKVHNKILGNNFKQRVKIITHSDQEGFVSGLLCWSWVWKAIYYCSTLTGRRENKIIRSIQMMQKKDLINSTLFHSKTCNKHRLEGKHNIINIIYEKPTRTMCSVLKNGMLVSKTSSKTKVLLLPSCSAQYERASLKTGKKNK